MKRSAIGFAMGATALLGVALALPGVSGARSAGLAEACSGGCLAEELASVQARLEEKFAGAAERLREKIRAQENKLLARLERLREEKLENREWLAEHARHQAEWARQHAEQARALAEQHAQDARRIAEEGMVWVEDDDSGWLGVSTEEVTAEKAKELKLAAERGVLLREVEEGSPAAKAGLKAGDVITEFNGQRVEGVAQFRRLVRETPGGRTAQLTVWREGRSQTIAVQLGSLEERIGGRIRDRIIVEPKLRIEPDFRFEMPELDIFALGRGAPVLGILADDLDGQLGAYFGAPDGEGVLVREVTSGSPAEKAGLKAGDVIVRVDGERVRTTSDLRSRLREKRESKSVSLGVIRKGAETKVDVTIEQPKPRRTTRSFGRRTTL